MKSWFSLMPGVLVLLFLFQLAPVTLEAHPGFGNHPDGSYGYGIYGNYPYPYFGGAAVSFTPTEDFSLDSVTLTLSNYTQTFGLELLVGTNYNNFSNFSVVGNFNNAPTNDGALGQFTFYSVSFNGESNAPAPLILNSNYTYWLLAYGGYNSSGSVDWVGGTTPDGPAIYNGTGTYVGGIGGGGIPAGLNANAPAFSLNPVPEPSTRNLFVLFGALLFCWRKRNLSHLRRKTAVVFTRKV